MMFDLILADAVEAATPAKPEELTREIARLRKGLEKTWNEIDKARDGLAKLQTSGGAASASARGIAALKEVLETTLGELDTLLEQQKAKLKN
jgi:hypothetical protein